MANDLQRWEIGPGSDVPDGLDFVFDWTDWLLSGDTIATFAVTIPAGITEAQPAAENDPGRITFWVTNPERRGVEYEVKCRVTTGGGRTRTRARSVHST